MCSITGLIRLGSWTPSERAAVYSYFGDLLQAAVTRGRDSWGICAVMPDDLLSERFTACFSRAEYERIISVWETQRELYAGSDPLVILNNHRAEPTTEYVKTKRDSDVQPFRAGHWLVAHNGTLANDKELLQELYHMENPPLPTQIDSWVIAAWLNSRFGSRLPSLAEMTTALKAFKGSYALAIVNTMHPQKVWLATNYKPLALEYDNTWRTLFFTSLEASFKESWTSKAPLEALSHQTVEIPPYTLVEVSLPKSGTSLAFAGLGMALESVSLRTDPRKKALVICSGGLDSVTAATLLIHQGYEVGLLHFRYGCVAQSREEECVQAVSDILQVPLYFLDIPQFKSVIAGSTLFQDSETYTKEKGGIAGAEFAYEWVPARNLVFLSLATALAEAQGYDFVASGVNLEESGSYPDNEMIFIQKLDQVLPFATNVDRQVHLLMPVGNLMKHEIVKAGYEALAPLEHTWSCYNSKEQHCGTCGPCFMRKTAFKMLKVKDPAFKHEWNDPFWDGCEEYVNP